ncbi:MAG: hypothetical protein FWG38_11485, partial [Defluviitaleaceae bacterium]|nr:hypothetical protein [Defluviitaleaceae bacterium]
MDKLVLFDDKMCREFSCDEESLYPQAVLIHGEARHFSTINIPLLRIGSAPGSHIVVEDIPAAL